MIDLSDHQGWVEIRENGIITSEWRPSDGEAFQILTDLLGIIGTDSLKYTRLIT